MYFLKSKKEAKLEISASYTLKLIAMIPIVLLINNSMSQEAVLTFIVNFTSNIQFEA